MICPHCKNETEEQLPIRYRFLSVNGKAQEVIKVKTIKTRKRAGKWVKAIPLVVYAGMKDKV